MASPGALVVDDDHDLNELIARVLTAVGYEVTTATDAESARRTVRETTPALVTLDLSLPGVTGTDLLRDISAATDAHVLLVTGHVLSDAERAEARLAGAADVLIKPFSLRDLREHAARLLAAEGATARAS